MNKVVLLMTMLLVASLSVCQKSYPPEYIIGESMYDLQTWRAMQNRIFLFDDQTIGGVMIKGDIHPSFPDQNIQYFYYDGMVWNSDPLEPVASGQATFPSYSKYKEDGEICVSQGNSGIYINWRENKGTGNWNEITMQGALKHPVVVASGTENEIVHMLYLKEDPQFVPNPVQICRGQIWYARSSDGLNSWDINQEVQQLNSAHYLGFTIGSYCWAEPKTDVLSFLAGDYLTDLVLMKSYDQGLTWQKTVIWQHPYPFFEIFSFQSDTFYCNDGGISISMDINGNAHAAFSLSRIYSSFNQEDDWVVSDVGGLVYWNETMEPFSNNINALNPYGHPDSELEPDYNLIGWLQDINGNGQIDTLGYYAVYPTPGLITMPQILHDYSEGIVVVFSALTETFDNGQMNYRHNWARLYHPNYGWGSFADLNSDLIHFFDECIYTSLSQGFDDYIHLIYQNDIEPGSAAAGSQPYYGFNKITYMGKDVLLSGLSLHVMFYSDTTEITEGEAVQFMELAGGNPYPDSVYWTFEGGTPSNSTLDDPVVVYENAGIFDVKLFASNGFLEDSLIKEDYITVYPYVEDKDKLQLNSFQEFSISAEGIVYINLPAKKSGIVQIISMSGEIIYKQVFTDQSNLKCDLSGIQPGIYIVNVETRMHNYSNKIYLNTIR